MAQTATATISSMHPITTIESYGTIVQQNDGEHSPSNQLQRELNEQLDIDDHPDISTAKAVIIIGSLFGSTFVGSFSTGILTVALPRMALDLNLADNLLLWPASVYALAIGCLLIIAGSVADLVGSRTIFLIGSFLQGIFIMACGISRTGIQLIMFRAMQGISVALCLPTAVSITTSSFENGGRRRNLGLACMGAGQPIGFLIGLLLGGVFVDTIGWRVGYYICTGAALMIFAFSFWAIPQDHGIPEFSWFRFRTEIDWIGAIIASTCLAMLSYCLAAITGSVSHIKDAHIVALLSVSLALVPTFIFWVGRQERLSKPALIPNSLWKNSAFTSICITLLLSWATLNVMEWFSSLFFQEVQNLSALQTSLRFLPSIVAGAAINIATGFLANKLRADYLIAISSFIAAISPLLMALTNPDWPYWYMIFWVMLLGPFSADVLFTIGALVITDAFPLKTQALGGAVFQTLAQFGTSLGLAITASISTSVTKNSHYKVKTSPEALLEGYRATFWVSFAWMLLATVIGGLGLRRAGRVGLKRE